MATGKYSDFKYVNQSKADNFDERFTNYSPNQLAYNETDEMYNFDENKDGNVDYSIGMPDFKSLSFISNLVIRWEYIPGSTLYFVWSQNKNNSSSDGTFRFNNDMSTLNKVQPFQVFLIKFSYRLKL